MRVILEQSLLLRNPDADSLAMLANQYLDHISDTSMIAVGRFTHSFLNRWINPQVERGGFFRGHG
jgi:hypothetical protein